MNPHDIDIFELLAALFTLGFLGLVYLLGRFIRGLERAWAHRHGPPPGPGDPGAILAELGPAPCRVHGRPASGADEPSPPAGA
jgi:hypothetical protein